MREGKEREGVCCVTTHYGIVETKRRVVAEGEGEREGGEGGEKEGEGEREIGR